MENNKWVRFDGQLMRKIEEQELKTIGVTEEGLALNYRDTNYTFYVTEDGQTFYQFTGRIGSDNFCGSWSKETFLTWINETSW